MSAARFLCVKTFSSKVLRHSLAYLSVHKWLVGDIPFDLKYWAKVPTPFKNGDFQSIFAHSDCIMTKQDDCKYVNTNSNVSSFLGLNCVVLSLGVIPNECVKEGYPSVESANLTNNLQ